MSFRVSALIATVAVFGLADLAPVCAQPQVPVRPRYSTFQSIFRPGNAPLVQPGPGFLGQPMPIGNAAGPIAPGFVYAGPLGTGVPQALSGAPGVDPALPPTGVVGTFGNYGHWYPNGVGGGGNYGHWYPGGVANGRGVLANTGGGGLYGGTGAGFGGGFRSLAGGAVLGAAAVGQFGR